MQPLVVRVGNFPPGASRKAVENLFDESSIAEIQFCQNPRNTSERLVFITFDSIGAVTHALEYDGLDLVVINPDLILASLECPLTPTGSPKEWTITAERLTKDNRDGFKPKQIASGSSAPNKAPTTDSSTRRKTRKHPSSPRRSLAPYSDERPKKAVIKELRQKVSEMSDEVTKWKNFATSTLQWATAPTTPSQEDIQRLEFALAEAVQKNDILRSQNDVLQAQIFKADARQMQLERQLDEFAKRETVYRELKKAYDLLDELTCAVANHVD